MKHTAMTFRNYVESWNRTGSRVSINIVGCGKDKASDPAPAMNLYRGDLTRKRIQIADALSTSDSPFSGTPFLILSAKHGLVGPLAVLDSYDVTIKTTDRAELVSKVRRQVDGIGAENGLTLTVEAGSAYMSIIEDATEGMDVRVIQGRVVGMVGRAKQIGRKILDWHDEMDGRTR